MFKSRNKILRLQVEVSDDKQIIYELFCRNPERITLRPNTIKPELRDLLIAQGKSPDDVEVC